MHNGKSILVIGGAGFIGSHTTLALKEAGFNVVIYDNFSTGHRDACFGHEVVTGELADQAKLTQVLKTRDIVCVVHFAALIEAGQSVIDPYAFYQNNVAATLSLLQAMRTADVTKIVFSSTAAVYGNQDLDLLSEGLPKDPVNPYGHSKFMVETMLQTAAEPYGLTSIALRYFNASGADPEGRTGERHDPETHLIPLLIQAALGHRDHFKIFGTDYDTPDGTCIRDYIHVSDLAQGHVAAVNRTLGQSKPGFEGMNLGTGTGHSVREVVDTVKRVSGSDFRVELCPRRAGDPAKLVADARRAKELLGWEATRSDLQTIVKDAWRFFSAKNTA
ncbi:MAG: UDP-glucose 4-epimerase GalE [Cognatishimia sp.]|nr:UDP-glucose 4-epimerase GalE [Cognatishimia sp.]